MNPQSTLDSRAPKSKAENWISPFLGGAGQISLLHYGVHKAIANPPRKPANIMDPNAALSVGCQHQRHDANHLPHCSHAFGSVRARVGIAGLGIQCLSGLGVLLGQYITHEQEVIIHDSHVFAESRDSSTLA